MGYPEGSGSGDSGAHREGAGAGNAAGRAGRKGCSRGGLGGTVTCRGGRRDPLRGAGAKGGAAAGEPEGRGDAGAGRMRGKRVRGTGARARGDGRTERRQQPGPAEREEGGPARAEAGAARSPDSAEEREAGRWRGAREGSPRGLGRTRDRGGVALSPGQVLQDLLLNDPGHAGTASRVEGEWAAVASSAVKRQLVTSARRGDWMPLPWRSPAPAGALGLRRDPTHLRGAAGAGPQATQRQRNAGRLQRPEARVAIGRARGEGRGEEAPPPPSPDG